MSLQVAVLLALAQGGCVEPGGGSESLTCVQSAGSLLLVVPQRAFAAGVYSLALEREGVVVDCSFLLSLVAGAAPTASVPQCTGGVRVEVSYQYELHDCIGGTSLGSPPTMCQGIRYRQLIRIHGEPTRLFVSQTSPSGAVMELMVEPSSATFSDDDTEARCSVSSA